MPFRRVHIEVEVALLRLFPPARDSVRYMYMYLTLRSCNCRSLPQQRISIVGHVDAHLRRSRCNLDRKKISSLDTTREPGDHLGTSNPSTPSREP